MATNVTFQLRGPTTCDLDGKADEFLRHGRIETTTKFIKSHITWPFLYKYLSRNEADFEDLYPHHLVAFSLVRFDFDNLEVVYYSRPCLGTI